jgi:hypothetical protein
MSLILDVKGAQPTTENRDESLTIKQLLADYPPVIGGLG